MAVIQQASLSDAACNNTHTDPISKPSIDGFVPDTAEPQPPAIADLPHYLVDNLPNKSFDAVVECRLDQHQTYTGEQYFDIESKPAKVLIDARYLRPIAFDQILTAYLLDKQKHPHKEATIITNNALTSAHKSMRIFRHTYTVGLRNDRCKIWHDPPMVLTNSQTLSSIFKCSLSGASAKILLDTGAAANCISHQFCKLMKIRVTPLANDSSVTGVSGLAEKVIGTAKVHTSIQSYKSNLRFMVIPMVTDYDAILGETWHASAKATTQYDSDGMKFVRIYKGRTMRKLIQTAREPMEGVSSKEPLMSHVQFNKARRKLGFFIAHVKFAPEHQGEMSPSERHNLPSLSSDHSSKVDPKTLEKLLAEFKIVFEPLPKGLPPLRETTGHTIPLVEGAIPPYRSPYRMSPLELREVRKQIQELLENKFIQPSKSPFGSPVLFVQKKDGSLRMCIDYRALNKLTIHDKYPLPRTDELLDKVKGANVFTSLDLTSGYHQIRIHPDDVPKTAFTAAGEHYEFMVLPFGLTNAPATFQRCMNGLFRHLPFVAVYLDDILIFSKTAEEHLQHIRQVLQILQENKLYCKMKKCEFNQTELRFVGHIVGAKGIRPDPDKISAVTDWPSPHNIHELRKFLGFTNYFRKFLQGYSQRTEPLTNLLRKNVAYEWTQKCQESFEQLKQDLTSAPVLISPDTTQSFI